MGGNFLRAFRLVWVGRGTLVAEIGVTLERSVAVEDGILGVGCREKFTDAGMVTGLLILVDVLTFDIEGVADGDFRRKIRGLLQDFIRNRGGDTFTCK